MNPPKILFRQVLFVGETGFEVNVNVIGQIQTVLKEKYHRKGEITKHVSKCLEMTVGSQGAHVCMYVRVVIVPLEANISHLSRFLQPWIQQQPCHYLFKHDYKQWYASRKHLAAPVEGKQYRKQYRKLEQPKIVA